MGAPGRSKHWQLLWVGGSLAIGAFFAYVFYVRYWKWRDCIAEVQSSCIAADGANLIAGGQLWSIPAVILIVVGLRGLLKYARSG